MSPQKGSLVREGKVSLDPPTRWAFRAELVINGGTGIGTEQRSPSCGFQVVLKILESRNFPMEFYNRNNS